ncbi:NAD-dependent epimerase/dehydratase family protein [Methylotenera sp.]|jgi:uncharacterized protein YbjT (DUF2867 family)|uniref:NAD-dependent epimerase/dehydratase family protein n=1 Tax=Methylotenera sp. TaxID=2051956 RepID=UPI00272FA661|nr:NAD-dependent epimerase/dehydratase family protein [Methylotenera sp.]MDP2071936.1 NAD-dependent epimerase/dehydratase family protein [Methylotenera sp.]MDP3005561.1 NAD-dependent epimerase/dehydratase family protein [Methylotenera sp.]
MKILVTGANGFVGKFLCAELHSQGYAVSAAVRSSSSLVKNAEMVTIGEIDGDTDWIDTLNGVDVVIHLAVRTIGDRPQLQLLFGAYRIVAAL